MLDEGEAPPPPQWTASFLASEGEYSELSAAVLRFQRQVTSTLWFLDTPRPGSALEPLSAEVEGLRAEKRYQGRQLVGAEFRSFDFRADDRAVVTVRETWQDSLYQFSEYPGDGGELIARRGPFTLDATYTLERRDSTWEVTGVVYANEPPAW